MPRSTPANKDTSSSPFSRGAQHRAKRTAILSCAAKLFNTKGARSTTLADVADKLGLTKTSLYYYVRTKEDLIYQCYAATFERMHVSLDQVELETDVPLKRVIKVMEQHIDTIRDALAGRGDYYAAPIEIAVLPDEQCSFLEAEYLAVFKRFRGYIRDGISDGSIRECHSTSTARALLTALDWSFYWLYEMPESQASDAKAAIRTLVTSGLLAGDSSLNTSDATIDDEALSATEGFNREAQNRMKQEAFLRAGIRQFNQKGFSGTSLDDIAESLNVSKGAFYYHFSNKEALLMQCYEFGIDQLGSLIDRVAKLDLSPTHKLKRICTSTFLHQNSALGPMIRYNSITSLPPPLRRQILARTEAHHARLSDLLSAGVTKGEVNANNMLVVRHLLVGAINGVADFYRWRRLDDPVQAASDFFDVFFHGLAPR